MEASQDDFDRQHVENDMSGNVYGTSGQFGNVYGDVHFHGPTSAPPPFDGAPKQAEGVRRAKRKKNSTRGKRQRREAAERARQQLRADDNKAIKGCGLLVLGLAVPGFIYLGLVTRDWAATGVVVGVVAVVLFLGGAGMAMRGD
ncbi:hypothetical protein ACIQM4_05840 [Streptomyces sp. NPDC091272]|uniref:hypothetical protein n=1 Tax=Streptomyces sp. NPDC091272 TaxID=3365981 RepID=UPI00380D260C